MHPDRRDNPFAYLNPTPPAHFVGRQEKLHEVVDGLYSAAEMSYAVVGGRRLGKSSFLNALCDLLWQQYEQAEEDELCVLPIDLSFSDLSSPTSAEDVFGLLCHAMHDCLYRRQHPRLKKLAMIAAYNEASDPEPISLQKWMWAISQIATSISDSGQVRIAFLMDEMDTLLDHPWTEACYSNLRSVIYKSPVSTQCRYVLAGSPRAFGLNPKGSSPLFNAVEPIRLGPISTDGVNELLRWAIDLPPDASQEIIRQGGGHPFILQYLLHYLYIDGLANATADTVRARASQFCDHRLDDLRGWEKAIGEDGRYAYQLLCQRTDAWTHIGDVQATAPNEDFEADVELRHLLDYGLVERDATKSHYRIASILFKNWFEQRYSAYQKATRLPDEKMPDGTKATEAVAAIEAMPTGKEYLRRLIFQYRTPGGIVPFVGAGIAITYGMAGWTKFLLKLAKQKMITPLIKSLLEADKYEEAAEELERGYTSFAFHAAIEGEYGDHKIQGHNLTGPVVNIVKLTIGPIITTNFDRLLEHAARQIERPFPTIVAGARRDAINRMMVQQRHGLIKIHGDWEERADRVLTKSEYDMHYGTNGIDFDKPLPKLLRAILTGRSLLFIGCGLKQDRTVEVLAEVARQSPEIVHFAIVECPKTAKVRLSREEFFGQHNILPVWYPNGRHDIIGPLLEHLAMQA